MLKITNNPNDKWMFFDNDDSFYSFAVIPELVTIENPYSPGNYYTDFNFTDVYNRAVNDGKKFVIRDPNSEIVKRGHISYRTITKPIEVYDEIDSIE